MTRAQNRQGTANQGRNRQRNESYPEAHEKWTALSSVMTLAVDGGADVAIFELADRPVEFVDSMNNTLKGRRKLVPVFTIRAGRPFGHPRLPHPFSF